MPNVSVSDPVYTTTRRDLFALLARGAAVSAVAPAFVALENSVFAQPVNEPCIVTELTADDLVRSARYVNGNLPITATVASTGPKTHQIEITSGTSPILTVKGDFSDLAKSGKFGVATLRVQSQGVDWSITVDGSNIPVSNANPLPAQGKLRLRIRSGTNTTTGSFDLKSWTASGLQNAPNLQKLLAADVVAAYRPFVPTMQAVIGYAAHHSPVGFSLHTRPVIAAGILCAAVCVVAFSAALAICGAAAPAGPVGWVVCAEAIALASVMCAAACS